MLEGIEKFAGTILEKAEIVVVAKFGEFNPPLVALSTDFFATRTCEINLKTLINIHILEISNH